MKKISLLALLLALTSLSGCMDMQQRECLMSPGAPAATLTDNPPPTASCLTHDCDGQ